MSQEPSRPDDTPSEDSALTIGDGELPEDLQPREDNPLAQPAGDDVPDDLLQQESGRSRSATHSGTDSEDADTGDDDASGTSSSAASSEADASSA